MSHARIEEVSESDEEMSDPSEGDIDDFAETDILRQIPTKKAPTQQQQQQQQAAASASMMMNPAHQPAAAAGGAPPQVQPSDIKDYQCLYPVYFDAGRSRAEGRRVAADLAVPNPLARDIATACARLRLQPVFEAHRAHPKDWANPGRVRVPLKRGRKGGDLAGANEGAASIHNKHHLYLLVARWLRENPATERSDALRRVRVPGLGMPDDDAPWPRPAVPRGWKMPALLPAYSPAMTGGGVQENFGDMMKEMQALGGPGGAGAGGPGGAGMPDMSQMANMMKMFGGGGGGPGPGESSSGGAGGGSAAGKKAKKGKK